MPENMSRGVFNVRIGQELHRAAVPTAIAQGIKLNEFVTKTIHHYVEYTGHKRVEAA